MICVSGEYLWNSIQEIFTKALNATPAIHQAPLRDIMSELRNDWNLLNNELSSISGHLKVSQNRWKDFNDSVTKIKKWLDNTRDNVKKYETKSELSEMKALLEKYESRIIQVEYV